MIKEFKNKYDIEVKLYDMKNRTVSLRSKPLNPEDFVQLEKLYNQIQKEKNRKNIGKVLRKQMAIVFGKTQFFYRRFAMNVINDCLAYATECYKNPTETQGELEPS